MPPFSGTIDRDSAVATSGGYYNYQQQQYHQYQAKEQSFAARQATGTTTSSIQIIPTASLVVGASGGSPLPPLPPLPVPIAQRQPRRSSYYQIKTLNSYGRLTSITEDRTVRFQPTIQVHEVLHINEYTDDEVDATWYSEEETQSIKAEASELARKMNIRSTSSSPRSKGNKKMFDYDTIRGIEERSLERAQQLHYNRISALHAVLREQRNQNKQGTQDPTSAIRESYQAFTAGCRQAAVDMAMIDAYEVQKCYYYDSDPSSDSESSSISGNGSCSDVDPYDDSSDMEGSPIDDCLGGVFSFLSLLLKKADSAKMSKGPLKF